jgi:hypothetical protein
MRRFTTVQRNFGDVMMKSFVGQGSASNRSYLSDLMTRSETLTYFIVIIFGFSFWFLMAVPFASHRESYWWLAMVHSQDFAKAFSFISKTYRPVPQGATWLGFLFLDPHIFPTSLLRQTLLQGFIYTMFVLAWWLIYVTAVQRRLFALLALVTGCVFFSGYVQLFHIYGIFYVPVIMMIGSILRFRSANRSANTEVWFAVVATLLAFWHPFATALFAGFYFGFYIETFRQRSKTQHVQAFLILLISTIAVAALVVVFPTRVETMTLHTRLLGFLVSYRTNEINLIASIVAFLLTQVTILSMGLTPKLKVAAFLFTSALSALFLLKSLPLLLLWVCAVLIKLLRLRCWSLFFLTLAAAVLPFGGGIGTPIYALFAVILAVYVTPLGFSPGESALTFVKTRYVMVAMVASTIVLLMVRAGVQVPIVTRAASPLLTERERTYQLENVLTWLHSSDYCSYEIGFAENADNPVDSAETVITRRNRPPAGLEDVQLFWKTVLQCQKTQRPDKTLTAIVTFGGPALPNSTPVFKIKGKYAGEATVWVTAEYQK